MQPEFVTFLHIFTGGFDMSPMSMEEKHYLLQLARTVILERLGEKPSRPLPARQSTRIHGEQRLFCHPARERSAKRVYRHY